MALGGVDSPEMMVGGESTVCGVDLAIAGIRVRGCSRVCAGALWGRHAEGLGRPAGQVDCRWGRYAEGWARVAGAS